MSSATRTNVGAEWPLTLRLFLDLLTMISAMVAHFIAIISATSIWQNMLHGRSTLVSVGLDLSLLILFGGVASTLGKRKTVGLSWRGAGLPIGEVSATLFFAIILIFGVIVILTMLLSALGWSPWV